MLRQVQVTTSNLSLIKPNDHPGENTALILFLPLTLHSDLMLSQLTHIGKKIQLVYCLAAADIHSHIYIIIILASDVTY